MKNNNWGGQKLPYRMDSPEGEIDTKEIGFEEAKKIRLEIMIEIDRFCRLNNIKYYLAFGTLLGAIRHKGFIPWDDDCDIMMPREDLERFLYTYKPNDRFETLSFKDKRGLFYGFACLVDKRTCLRYNNWLMPGIKVEIYPIDKAPSNKLIQWTWFKSIGLIQRLEHKMVVKVINRLMDDQWTTNSVTNWRTDVFTKAYYSWGTLFNGTKSSKCAFIFGCPYKKHAFDASLFKSGITVSFEGHNLIAPQGWNEFLSSTYGDYMQLP